MSLDPNRNAAEEIAEAEMLKRFGENWRVVGNLKWAYEMVADVAESLLNALKVQQEEIHASYKNRPNNWN